MSLSIIIVDKIGELKTLNVKNYCEQELYKKCGFKKDTNFFLQTTWNIILDDVNYSISMYGKTDGKKNFENTCKFPYPINDKTFYGSCALVASSGENKINLSKDLWKQFHKQITNQSSFSFVNISQVNSKMDKKDKQKKKEQEKEKEREKEKDQEQYINEIVLEQISENVKLNDLKELEEEEYYYSSDEEK
jgi:hypothetical protein